MVAGALRKAGVNVGDRVVGNITCISCDIYLMSLGYLPNSDLAVVAMLATASLGAIWSSTSPDFGVTVSLYWAQCLCILMNKVSFIWHLFSLLTFYYIYVM